MGGESREQMLKLSSNEGSSISAETGQSANSDIQILLYRKWQSYNVSPLYRCDFSESQLKRQAKWLSQQLKMEMTQNAFECAAEEVQVRFNLLPHFFNSEAGNQLQILVEKKSKDNKIIVIYEGIFINCSKKVKHSSVHKYFPLLLCRGRASSIKQINLLVRKLFDCQIYPTDLTNNAIFHWLFVLIFLQIDSTSKEDETLTLTTEINNLEYVDLCLPLTLVRSIWVTIHKGSGAISEMEIIAFENLFLDAIHSLCSIRFDKFLFSKIQVKDTILLRNGTIKTKNDARMADYIRFMQFQTHTLTNYGLS